MSTSSPDGEGIRPARSLGLGECLLRRALRGFEAGSLTVNLPSGERVVHRGVRPGREAAVTLHRWRALRRLAIGGDLGFAEAYIDGDWSSRDLTTLIELAAENAASLDPKIAAPLAVRALSRLRHLLRPNSKAGSRRNIAFHYDLGNEFYRRWLDPGMIYSSALYDRPTRSLAEAQETKLARVVDLLELQGGEDVLEIGCGWGTLARRIARSGAKVTAITLSTEQLAFARALAAAEQGPEFRLQDYRDVDGSFDRVVSIEMLEAVGERYWPDYFAALRARLRRGGTAVLQVITIDEARFDAYRNGADFIQSYIFPGGMLPTKSILASEARRAGFEIATVQTFGSSYALTLAAWRARFHAAWPEVRPLGFTPEFRRLWEYYFSYCEAGFRTGAIDVGLYALR
ncbi:MAG: cyclopropane-fatty-acyl-phospholipid synthase family protein [Amaricoccus sp.]